MNVDVKRKIGQAAWVVGVLLAVVWGGLRSVSYEARGVGFAPPVNVASLEGGRLATLDVQLHDDVMVDTVVARLDTTPLEEEKLIISAQLLAVQSSQATDAASEARRFAEGLEEHQLDLARLEAVINEDAALQLSLREQAGILARLEQDGATSALEMRLMQRELDVVTARLDASRHAVAVARNAVGAARTRSDGLSGENEWSVVAAARALDQVEARISRMDLSAGIEGQVTAIYRSPGEVVAAGEVVMEIRQRGTSEVVAWLPYAAASGLVSGSRAHVVRVSGEILAGNLLSVGSGPQQLPVQLWNNPAYPEWGLPVRIKLTGGEVGAAEPVTVRL
jgi:multidrug resistance efflux pump